MKLCFTDKERIVTWNSMSEGLNLQDSQISSEHLLSLLSIIEKICIFFLLSVVCSFKVDKSKLFSKPFSASTGCLSLITHNLKVCVKSKKKCKTFLMRLLSPQFYGLKFATFGLQTVGPCTIRSHIQAWRFAQPCRGA